MRSGRRWAAAAALVVVGSLLAGCTTEVHHAAPTAAATAAPAAALTGALDSLPDRSAQRRPARLTAGLPVPTNRWFSGLVFGAAPQPVFPMPLSLSAAAHGFSIGLPKPVATADTIFGSAVAGLGLRFGGAPMRVVRYDALTVTSRFGDADVLSAEGWPYVAVTARRALTASFTAPVRAGSDGTLRAEVGGTVYAVKAPDGAVSGTTLRLAAGQRAVLWAVPDGVPASTLATGADGVVTGSAVTHGVSGNWATTRLQYRTAGNRSTVLAANAVQQAGGAGCRAGSVLSSLGTLSLCTGRALTSRVAVVRPTASISLQGVSDARLAAIRAQLTRDLRATPAEPADTYGGGKWLYRLANLVTVAKAAGATAAAADARKRLDAALVEWTEPGGCRTRTTHCFVHDARIGGVVGLQASYGSDEFNDHDFHYGYFLYAAAVAVADRPALAKRIGPVIDLLAADVASPTSAAGIPALRMYDPWAGHSWASGYAPFADGNNQESTSEAVNAWNGLALWAGVRGRSDLRSTATWLLANEAAAAKAFWLDPDLSAFPAFRHSFVSLVWGGKRDSATWFSADPAAKLGIQLIPMSPVAGYLRTSPSAMRADLAEARSARTGLFADYLLMDEVLAGGSKSAALRRLAALPAAQIDSANSKAYAAAWILSR
ncbi:glycosyl hydrolase [Amnibacterium kyonggiense]|uniref:glucan endo-1,3-beta-D-glucosidase n=1 Tax=Amnibacterium kyonggiense TaxID=595671 RepID=A0A4R7FFF4_9MICO|nr:glycosyl hydrolase [Amnibacterium kyonggiense]TDS74873.1 endoglucanase Acf2 [Amnibacterium kyonggiense]